MTSCDCNIDSEISDPQTQRIRALNDQLRTTLQGGRIVVTPGIMDLPQADYTAVLAAMMAFSNFSEDNDPRGEHDFALMEVRGHKVMWKIDYYDLTMNHLSPDPGDPAVTNRVLTIMLAHEY